MAITPDQLTSDARKRYNQLRRDEPWADNETLAELARDRFDDAAEFDELRDL